MHEHHSLSPPFSYIGTFLLHSFQVPTNFLQTNNPFLSLQNPIISQNMAKTSKLTKLKSAIKRWPSFTKLARTHSSIAAASNDHCSDNIIIAEEVFQAVYVGKSRRPYFLSSDTICHPLFQELIERSGGFDDGGEIVVSCEVVLFEHLLWMLQSNGSQLGSMEELAEFYYTR